MAKKEAKQSSAKAALLAALGAVTVGDKLSPEIMSKISELHTLLTPPPRVRRKKTATTTAATSTATTKTEVKKGSGFRVSPRPPETDPEPFS